MKGRKEWTNSEARHSNVTTGNVWENIEVTICLTGAIKVCCHPETKEILAKRGEKVKGYDRIAKPFKDES